MTVTNGRPVLYNERDIKSFLSYMMCPELGCTEFRVFRASHDFKTNQLVSNDRFKQTFAGWYDRADALFCDIVKLHGVSGYLTMNPAKNEFLALKRNGFIKVSKDQCVTDDSVTFIRHFFIDIDPIRHPKDISTTDAELALAVARRDAILSDHPRIMDDSIWGKSGNGAWIVVRLADCPNDERHRKAMARMNLSLVQRYSDAQVDVDVKTKNPSRVMCIPGTYKCKGENTPERPWRLATLDGWGFPIGSKT